MVAAMIAILSYCRRPVHSFEPADLKSETPSESFPSPAQRRLQDHHSPSTFSPPAPAASSARPPVILLNDPIPEASSSRPPSQHAPPSASPHLFLSTTVNPSVNECGHGESAAFPDSNAPPPLPPKPPVHERPKSVSILAPTDISPARRSFSHSASDARHISHTSTNLNVPSPAGVPARPRLLTLQHLAARVSVVDTSPFSSDALNTHPSGMEPVIDHDNSSSAAGRRNKLHKARPRPPSPAPANSTVFGLLSRAFGSGSGESFSRHGRSNSAPSMSDRSYRPTRSLSDGSTKASLSHPAPSSRSSETADSSCTTSSYASTSLSYVSTPITTPDSTSSPGLSPRNSTRTNKLHKKRPSLAPSAYLYPPGTHATALGRSKSTPNGLGQRSPRNRIWSSVEEARQAAEEAERSAGHEPALWYSSPTEASLPRGSTLRPIFEVRRRSSSQALSELACTGFCSTSVAAHSSQLVFDAQSTDLHALQDHVWREHHADQFNPYVGCTSPTDATIPPDNLGDHTVHPVSDPTESSFLSGVQEGREGSSSGFAVVTGYLDRSEDAMRRWTLAMADVPDDVLVQHLERLRKESMALARGRLPGRRSAAPSQVGHGDDELTVDSRDRRSSFFFGGPREMGIYPRSPSRARFSVGHYERDPDGDDSDDEALSDEEDEEDWKTARQVLFRCRELVQTERNYQDRLRELASTELSHHFASLVARYIPALLRVSETLLAHVMDDPSAWGVSAAFIGCEEELESAFVAWSEVAGEFFIEDAVLRPSRKLTKKLAEEVLSNQEHDTSSSSLGRIIRTRSHIGLSPSYRGSAGSRRRFSSTMSDIGHGETYSNVSHDSPETFTGPGMFTAALGTGLAFGLGPHSSSQSPLEMEAPGSPKSPKLRSAQGNVGLWRVSTIGSGLSLSRAVTAWKRKSMPSSLTNIPSLLPSSPIPPHPKSPSYPTTTGHAYHHVSSSAHGHGSPKKVTEQGMKMTARDLAIQPTQRVMRYVLQYRDLLDHTPISSPSRALVERAHESALRIAKKCDRAQAHASFFRQSAAPTPIKSNKHATRSPTTFSR